MLALPLPRDAEMVMRVPGLGKDAPVMPSAREHEGDVSIGEKVEFEYGSPRRDVVLLRRDHEKRPVNIEQNDRAAINLEIGLR